MIVSHIGNKPTDRGRFLTKFLVDDGCWEWTGSLDDKGYGQFWSQGKNWRGHVYSYRMFRDDVEPGQQVCHSCDKPSCVNPSHLFLGTVGDNARDRDAKRRGKNSSKTHCPQGHEYTEENTYRYPNGWRRCRICLNTHNRIADFRRRQARKGLI